MATMQSKKKKKGRASSLVVFLLVFVLFLVIFGGLCLWAIVRLNQDMRGKSASSASLLNVSGTAYSGADARNLLIIPEDDGQAQSFVILRLDPANVRIRSLALPRETYVTVGTEQTRLFELYAGQGVKETEKAVAELLNIEIDHYAVITYANLQKIITYLNNGVLITLTENLDYTSGDGGYTLKLNGGRQILSAAQVVDVLRYPAWHGGRRQQSEIHSEITTAMINQYLTEARKSKADEDFSNIVNLMTTDIRVSHYNESKDALLYLASRNTNADICAVTKVEGEYVGSGAEIRFEVQDQATNLKNTFSNHT